MNAFAACAARHVIEVLSVSTDAADRMSIRKSSPGQFLTSYAVDSAGNRWFLSNDR